MRIHGGRAVVAALVAAGVLVVSGCDNGSDSKPGSAAPSASAGVTATGGSTATGASTPMTSADTTGTAPVSASGSGGTGGTAAPGRLPADGAVEMAELDSCAVLVAAVGTELLTTAMGDAVADSWTVFGNCSMETKEYTINSAGSTSTGRLSFGIATSSLASTAEQGGTPVDGLTGSSQGKNSIIWQRAPYWFSLQILPVQKAADDPDVIDAALLTQVAKAINEHA